MRRPPEQDHASRLTIVAELTMITRHATVEILDAVVSSRAPALTIHGPVSLSADDGSIEITGIITDVNLKGVEATREGRK